MGPTIRERALTSIAVTAFTPKTGQNRLHSMIENAPRLGALAPARLGRAADLLRASTGARAPTTPISCCAIRKVNARILEAFEAEGADAWYKDGAKARFLGNDHDPDAWEQVFDILDVWFDSGSTHAFVLRDRPDGTEDGIADLYLEGTDQHRGWFHSSLLQGCGTIGRAPYRGVRDPCLHPRREGQQDVQVAGQHHRSGGGRRGSTAPTSCGFGWPRPTTPMTTASGPRS
jgi:isoleucyl-tRNA synthetase